MIPAVEVLLKALLKPENARRLTEMRHRLRISRDQSGSTSDDQSSGQPVMSLSQLDGKKPDILLVLKKISWKRAPGCLALYRSDDGIGRGRGRSCGVFVLLRGPTAVTA